MSWISFHGSERIATTWNFLPHSGSAPGNHTVENAKDSGVDPARKWSYRGGATSSASFRASSWSSGRRSSSWRAASSARPRAW